MAERTKNAAPQGTSRTEWTIAAIGALLLAAMITLLTIDALNEEPGPPDLVVTAGAVTPAAAGFTVLVTVANRGGTTADAVEIEGMLLSGDTVVETARASLDMVAKGSERQAGLIFSRDPANHGLRLRALGYALP